jgi:hypothetical protein
LLPHFCGSALYESGNKEYYLKNNYRLKLAVAFVAAVALGALSRLLPLGAPLWDKYLGDVVYAMVFYLFLSLIYTKSSITRRALITSVYVVAVEFFQLTHIPALLYRIENPALKLFVYVVLGTSFSWWDIVAYAVGIAAIAALDHYVFIKSHNGDRIKKEVCS